MPKTRPLWPKSGRGRLPAAGNGKNFSLMVKIRPKPTSSRGQWQNPVLYGQNQASAGLRLVAGNGKNPSLMVKISPESISGRWQWQPLGELEVWQPNIGELEVWQPEVGESQLWQPKSGNWRFDNRKNVGELEVWQPEVGELGPEV